MLTCTVVVNEVDDIHNIVVDAKTSTDKLSTTSVVKLVNYNIGFSTNIYKPLYSIILLLLNKRFTWLVV